MKKWFIGLGLMTLVLFTIHSQSMKTEILDNVLTLQLKPGSLLALGYMESDASYGTGIDKVLQGHFVGVLDKRTNETVMNNIYIVVPGRKASAGEIDATMANIMYFEKSTVEECIVEFFEATTTSSAKKRSRFIHFEDKNGTYWKMVKIEPVTDVSIDLDSEKERMETLLNEKNLDGIILDTSILSRPQIPKELEALFGKVKTYKGKIIQRSMTNKVGTKLDKKDYFLKTKDKKYFIKLSERFTQKDIKPYVGKKVSVRGVLIDGLWDTDDPTLQSRVGNYLDIHSISKK